MSKKSLIAAMTGGASGALMFYLLAVPIISLIFIPLGGIMAGACYEVVLRGRIDLIEGCVARPPDSYKGKALCFVNRPDETC